MSTWTHVVGAIRFDGLPRSFKMIESRQLFDAIMQGEIVITKDLIVQPLVPQREIPSGSEGPLQYTIHEYMTGLPWIIVPIWGDLMDYENVREIKEWFEHLTSSYPLIRDGVLHVQVEDKEPFILSYKSVNI